MNYWLMKSEPETFSIDDLKSVKQEPWDGVRNYQARNMMRDDMKIGDKIFFYHSNCKPPGIVGIARVASKPYPDPTQFDKKSQYYDPKSSQDNPRWILVDVKFEKKFKAMLPLDELKTVKALADLPLVRKGNRLSIMPVTEKQWQQILELTER